MRSRHLSIAFTALALLLGAGCDNRPTYPKAYLAQSLQEVLNGEQLHASVRFLNHTLAVQLEYPNTLVQMGNQIGIGPAFDEATRKVLTGIHRVLLSTDAEVEFYVLLLSDSQTPGAYLTMVRYMDDVRRANANMLDTTEIFSRTVFDLNYIGPTASLTIDQYVPREIRLGEFLSWQLARRIQHKLTEDLQAGGTAVGRCGGEFRNGEFAFTLNVVPINAGPVNEELLQKIFQTSTTVIAQVLSSYRFRGFDTVRLIYPTTGRNLVLPKARLELFR